MAKAPSNLFDSGPTRRSLAGPFARAALSSRFIGVAAITLGAITFYLARKESALGRTDVKIIYTFSFIFLIPGLLYIVLATFVARQRRWAVTSSLALAMLDMTLLGLLFVTCWGVPGAAIVCVLAGLFVVALAVMTTHLGRSLEALRNARTR